MISVAPMVATWFAFLTRSPARLALWLGNRLTAWTGLAVLWRKLKDSPNRFKRFLLWGAVINVVSVLCAIGVARMLHVW